MTEITDLSSSQLALVESSVMRRKNKKHAYLKERVPPHKNFIMYIDRS